MDGKLHYPLAPHMIGVQPAAAYRWEPHPIDGCGLPYAGVLARMYRHSSGVITTSTDLSSPARRACFVNQASLLESSPCLRRE